MKLKRCPCGAETNEIRYPISHQDGDEVFLSVSSWDCTCEWSFVALALKTNGALSKQDAEKAAVEAWNSAPRQEPKE